MSAARVAERRRRRVLVVVEDELVPVDAGDRRAVGAEGNREVAAHQASLARHVGLPAAPHHRVALFHEEPGADLRRRAGIVRVGTAVDPMAQSPLASPVEDIVEDAPVAPARIDGLEDLDIHRVLDSATPVTRSPLQVHDPRVPGIRRVELALGVADQPLVCAHVAEHVALEGRAVPLRDHESGDLGVGARRDQERDQGAKDRRKRSGSSHLRITWFGGFPKGARAGGARTPFASLPLPPESGGLPCLSRRSRRSRAAREAGAAGRRDRCVPGAVWPPTGEAARIWQYYPTGLRGASRRPVSGPGPRRDPGGPDPRVRPGARAAPSRPRGPKRCAFAFPPVGSVPRAGARFLGEVRASGRSESRLEVRGSLWAADH